jgi:hypothetical protein
MPGVEIPGVEIPPEVAAPRLRGSTGRSKPSTESKPSLLTRLRTKLRSRQLDRALAAGASPSESGELSLRAEQLATANRRLANAIEHLILRSELDPRFDFPQSPLRRTPFNRANIRANRASLDDLADALRGSGPLPVRGLAMASALVHDRAGPLYVSDSVEQVEGVVRETVSALS